MSPGRFPILLLVVTAMAASPIPGGAAGAASFFSWRAPLPEALGRALEGFAAGDFERVVAASDEVLRSGEKEAYHDDALLLRGLAAEAMQAHGAVKSFRRVLERPAVSPLHPLATLGLVRVGTESADWAGVAASCRRHVRIAWRADDERGALVGNLLAAFGDVIPGPGPVPFPEGGEAIRESRLERASRSRDRPAERLLYLCGQGGYRAGEYALAVDVLRRIAPASPYRFYALYTAAQALVRLDRTKQAERVLRSIVSAPPADLGESALRGRATLFLARLRLDRGEPASALRVVHASATSGAVRYEASLFQGAVALVEGEPALAASYYREVPDDVPEPKLRVLRAIGLARSWIELGKVADARELLESNRDFLERKRERLAKGSERPVERLRRWVLERARRESRVAAEHRRRLVRGLRTVAEFDTPVHLGKLVRAVLTPHRNTVIGEPVYDVATLAAEPFRSPFVPEHPGALWFAYLDHPDRAAIDRIARRRLDEAPSVGRDRFETKLREVVTVHRRELRRLQFAVEEELSRVLVASVRKIRPGLDPERSMESSGAATGVPPAP